MGNPHCIPALWGYYMRICDDLKNLAVCLAAVTDQRSRGLVKIKARLSLTEQFA